MCMHTGKKKHMKGNMFFTPFWGKTQHFSLPMGKSRQSWCTWWLSPKNLSLHGAACLENRAINHPSTSQPFVLNTWLLRAEGPEKPFGTV